MRYRGEVLDDGKPFAEIVGGEPFPPLVTVTFHVDDSTIDISMDPRQARELARHLKEASAFIGLRLAT